MIQLLLPGLTGESGPSFPALAPGSTGSAARTDKHKILFSMQFPMSYCIQSPCTGIAPISKTLQLTHRWHHLWVTIHLNTTCNIFCSTLTSARVPSNPCHPRAKASGRLPQRLHVHLVCNQSFRGAPLTPHPEAVCVCARVCADVMPCCF